MVVSLAFAKTLLETTWCTVFDFQTDFLGQ